MAALQVKKRRWTSEYGGPVQQQARIVPMSTGAFQTIFVN